MKPTEVFDYGKVVYTYINNNPLVTRGGLNSQYRTSSDDRRNQNLTWVLEALLARQYIFKFTDKESSTVYFWTREHTRSPYQPDPVPELNYEPVDVFGKRPVVPEPKVPDEPMGAPIGVPPPAAPPVPPAAPQEDLSSVQAVMESQLARLKGSLRSLYSIMMEHPCKLYSKHDARFAEAVPSMPDRARFLGRMFGLGAIRRFKDPKDKNVSYYTLFGDCPASLDEDLQTLSHSARKQQAKVKAVMPPRAEKVDPPREPWEEMDTATEADLETAEAFEEELDAKDEVTTSEGPPVAFLGSNGQVVLGRSNGEIDELDSDESMALIELFLMTNHEALSKRLAQMKEAQ